MVFHRIKKKILTAYELHWSTPTKTITDNTSLFTISENYFKRLYREKHNVWILWPMTSKSSEAKHSAWREDLQDVTSVVEWESACKEAQTVNKLLQYNWLMCIYITPEKLNKCNSNIPDLCFKCWQSKETFPIVFGNVTR